MSKGSSQTVSKVYYEVIDDVINNVSEYFNDEGADEAILQDLKAMWKKKLEETKALEPHPEEKKAQQPYTYKRTDPSDSGGGHRPGGTYMRVIPAGGGGGAVRQPTRLVAAPGGGNRVQRIIANPQGQTVYRTTTQGDVNGSGSSGQIVYRTVTREPQQVGRIVHRGSADGGGTRNILIRQSGGATMGGNSRGITRVIPSGNSQPVIVRSSDRQPVIRGIHNIQSDLPPQLDGDDVDDDSDLSDSDEEESEPEEQNTVIDEDPLGPEDDIDGASDSETFETDNVVVCQFDKIQRVRSKWRFSLKDGIMSLKGKDHVFQKASGDAEW